MRRTRLLFIFIALAAFTAGLALAQNNPFIGVWKLNVAKSKFSPGPPPKSRTETFTASGDTITNMAEGLDAQGKSLAFTYTCKYDDKECPVTGRGPNGADTVSVKRIDANTVDVTFRKSGKVVQTTRSVVSKNGKTRTSTAKGTNESGQPTSNVNVWERQ